jgi:allantoin racemase
VDIPVVSLPETAFLIACSLAERFALVTLSPSYARRLTEVVARHGMAPRLAGIYTLGEGLDERGASAALDDPRPLLGALDRAAAEAVAAGADLLLPSEGILNEVLYANQVRQVQGAAIMDCVGLALMQAEMFVRARRTMGITYGRAWSYPLAPPALQARMRRNAGLPDLPDAKP